MPILPLARARARTLLVRIHRSPGFRAYQRARYGGTRRLALGDTLRGFWHPAWLTVDMYDADYICDLRSEPIPLEDRSVDVIYSSHFIEHIDRVAAQRLLGECARVLRPGGTLRIVTPDLDILLDRYRTRDAAFFMRFGGQFIFDAVAAGSLPAEHLELHNRLINWLASYSGRLDIGGGPTAEATRVDEALERLDKYGFRDWCVSLMDLSRVPGHVHVYDFDELAALLARSGFRDVARSGVGQSRDSFMRADSPDRPTYEPFSLYVEASRS